jgi:ribonuclease E
MEKKLYIDASHPDETRIVLKSSTSIEEYEYEDKNKINFKNNIYLGTVGRVEPSLQAAFIDFGRIKHGFLAFNDIQSDYYQIPTDDKEKLQEAEEKIREDLKNKNLNVSASEEVQTENETIGNETTSENNKDNQNQLSDLDNQKNERERLKNTYGVKRYRIQEVIKPGQVILIQVLKEERGQKGAALTTFISLAGKYIVLMPNTAKGGGISRKISVYEERNKIRKILNQIEIPKSMGVIVRTAGASKTKNEIDKDFQNTIKTWDQIKDKALESNAPSLIYEEGDIIKRALRDIYDNETTTVLVDGNEGYQKTKSFMKELIPKNVKHIKKHKGKIPLFHDAGIEKELNNIFEPTVKLKSGGYLVINPTEALVSIDINSGQSTKASNIEKTALNTNLEAAEEIAKQIKIRDLSGLIVIDFIDMFNFYNRKLVEKKMRESIKKDRARIQVGRISTFGLLEMSRQRLKEGSVIWESNLSLESFALKIVKKAEMLAFSDKVKSISIYVPEKVKLYIDATLKKEINYFEKKFTFKIELLSSPEMVIPEYSISLLGKNKKLINKIENLKKIKLIEEKIKIKKVRGSVDKTAIKEKSSKSKVIPKKKEATLKGKKAKLPRTLWVRRKKKKAA